LIRLSNISGLFSGSPVMKNYMGVFGPLLKIFSPRPDF